VTGPPSQAPDVGDAELAARALSGDTIAFERLYRANVGRVYALCLRMCGSPTLAEELTQMSFVRGWEKLGTFRGRSAFSTWMHRVAVNVVLGHARTRSRRPEAVPFNQDRPFEPGAPAQAKAEQSVDLERAIGRLPDRAREVFVLHDVEGYRHDEIAGLTGMAVGTSRAHLHRARRLLREALSP